MTFDTNFGGPVDPAYIAFRDGLERAVQDVADKSRHRWNPVRESWYVYAADWVLEDLNLADTSPENVIERTGFFPDKWKVQTLFLPQLWERLVKAHAAHAARYPSLNLVWSPWGGGDWRSAFQRTGSPPSNGGPGKGRDPDPRVQEQIDRINEWLRLGYISADQAQKMITKVLETALPDA